MMEVWSFYGAIEVLSFDPSVSVGIVVSDQEKKTNTKKIHVNKRRTREEQEKNEELPAATWVSDQTLFQKFQIKIIVDNLAFKLN